MKTIRFVLALHNHQPVGNFDHVFEAAYQDSYAPFLDVIKDYPDIPFVLHTSGCLLEWLQEHHGSYIDCLRELHDRNQLEIMGGGFHEPILTMIPRRDRVGQIVSYTRHLEDLFGCRVRGMWVPERVWEQSLVSDLVDAGIEYIVLDDIHFRHAGLTRDDLWGYYLSEDQGKLLRIFPGSEDMRYLVPFQSAHRTIEFLQQVVTEEGEHIVALADDGEKFGTWPNTKKHVYQDGWLRAFLDLLQQNRYWLRTVTFADCVDALPPVGKVYLPDCSYREMNEWVLPPERLTEYEQVMDELDTSDNGDRIKQFIRGGFWRNFKMKYPESDQMYARMLEISDRVAALDVGGEEADQARQELYRSQCNCSYWHGAFGGLYLPHLRHAVYAHLIAAEKWLDRAEGRTDDWVQCRCADFDLDTVDDVRLANSQLVLYLSPRRGGCLYELDLKQAEINVAATLTRRPEAYHADVIAAARGPQSTDVKSIHDLKAVKQPDLDKKLLYDTHARYCLQDHFYGPEENLQRLVQCQEIERGDFVDGLYELEHLVTYRTPGSAELIREGTVDRRPVIVAKIVALGRDERGFDVLYQFEGLDTIGADLRFGVEFNLAGFPGNDPQRYFEDAGGRCLGTTDAELDVPEGPSLAIVDRARHLRLSLHVTPAAAFWTFPIQTVSQSESGFELVYQCATVIPRWPVATLIASDRHLKIRLDVSDL